MNTFIKNVQDDRAVKYCPNLANQIQMCATIQLAKTVLQQMAHNSHEVIHNYIIKCRKNI